MLKLLLVDDEQPILDGLKVLIEWDKHGIGLVESASNGREALDKALRIRPDIVVTDIRMPVMGGLELIKALKEKLPDTKSIIISGYQEFEYAKEAMKFGAAGYLLKPIDEDELVSLLESTVAACVSASKERDILAGMSRKLNESAAYIRNKLLYSIVTGEAGDYNSVKDAIKNYNIGKLPDRYICFIIDLEQTNEKCGFSVEDIDLIRFATANITDEIINAKGLGQVFYSTEAQVVALFEMRKEMDHLIEWFLRDIISCVQNFTKTPVTIGVSNVHEGFGQIASSFREAKSALKYKFLIGRGKIIQYKDVADDGQRSFSIPLKIEKSLVNCVLCGDRENMPQVVGELFSEFMANKVNPDKIIDECTEILMIIKRSINAIGSGTDRISSLADRLRAEAYSSTIDELKSHFVAILEEAASEIAKSNYSGARVLISQIKEYINQNYSSQITLNTISEKFYINSSYVSRLFKKELSENFIDYLTGMRIEEAKKLLAGTDLKVYEITERIGYNNSKYFSQLFEKMTGMTPKKYREVNRK